VEPIFLEPGSPPTFPDARRADAEGLVAVGGDLAPARLLAAYRQGIFPWYDERLPPLWWSPDPRALLQVDALHVPRRLERRQRRTGFGLTWNRDFPAVMRACARNRAGGTWILPEMIDAYARLHALGHAHSVEVWAGRELVGGLYGVQVGGLFAAESMFHRRSDASKIALVAAVRSLFAAGIELFDVQLAAPHLLALGAREWPRERYLMRLRAVRDKPLVLTDLVIEWQHVDRGP
jgi:leucyl/phenylalanyl-tRNA--protein transferase